MGITLCTLEGLLGPLHHMMDWFAARLQQSNRPAKSGPPLAQQPAAARGPLASGAAVAPRPCGRARRPLRVVRIVEPAITPAGAGRMFMSGRMADVCAELDRLAALEAR